MKLVHNARSFWRWTSVQILAVLAVLPAVWPQLPPDLRASIPDEWQPYILSVLAVAGIVGRLRDQGTTR